MKKKSKNLLGIIGGMGPLADVTFLRYLNEMGDCGCDYEHIPVLYDGNCKRADRSDFLIGRSKRSPLYSIIYSLKRLEACGADVIAMPCNTAHYFLPYLKRKKRRRTVIIDMIDEACRTCYDRGYKKVCLLATRGTYKKELYSEGLFRMGVDLVIPDRDTIDSIEGFIRSIKGGEKTPISELEKDIMKINVDAFIAGCTELSRSLELSDTHTLTYVDSLEVLARRTLEIFGIPLKAHP